MVLQSESASTTTSHPSDVTTSWHPVCHITYVRDTWVKLLQTPSNYAADEAKLLCQSSNHAWVVWVPDHGEEVLDRSEFYC